MATTAGSTLRSNVFNEANEALYDPYPGLNQALNEYLIDIPWPEWNDADLNREIWEDQAGGPDGLYEDSNPPRVPIMLRDYVYSWKRPFELFPEESLTVYDPNNSEFELSLISSNGECELFQCFNELVTILQIYASKYNFPVEWETSNFVANTQDEVWRPWHHVYSCCKAGKGLVHRPLYNPFGRYIIRLFYMGAWRKFVIDDRIPCDFSGRCMLPVTQSQGELWPILLAKGFLKIVSLTPSFSLFDFPILTFLTGWTNLTIGAKNKSSDQIWRRLLCLIPRHESQDEEVEVKTVLTSVKGSSKIPSSKGPDKLEPQTKHLCFVLGTLEGFPENPNLLYSHRIGLTMCRDMPLVKCGKREATKAWKRIRWVYWASAKGIWTDENELLPYRRTKYMTCVRKVNYLLAPDPKQEATLFEISDVEEADSQFQGGDMSIYEFEEWLDFNKLQRYLSSLDVLFKPSCFPSNFKVTCLDSNALNKVPESSGGKKTATKTAPQSSPAQPVFFQPPTMLPNQNEPCLLFCESVSHIAIIMSLWVYPRTENNLFGYLDSEQPIAFKIGQASLVVERSDWRTAEQGEILGIIKSVGNSSFWFNLSPGRHILKLWLKSEFPYVVSIHSNVEVVVHKGPRTRFLMSAESERILQYIGNVSNAFIALTQKFGKPDLGSALRDFYEAIKPKNDKVLDYGKKMDDFIETFLLCILLSCKNLASSTDEVKIMMEALRSLFLNPNICCDLPRGQPSVSLYGGSAKKGVKKVAVVLKERTLSQILGYPWLPEEIKKIILIQRVFRGYRVRLLWKFQTPARKEFKFFTDKLKKICDIIFSPAKREFEVGRLIREVAMMNPKLRTTFKFHEDFSKVIQVEEFTGKIGNAEPFAWIPFARFIIACHSNVSVPYAVYFSSNLEHFVIEGVDNDTGEKLFRVRNSVMTHYYQSNMTGYTILIYGWNEANVKTVNWRLQMVKMRHFQLIHLCNTMLGSPCHPYSIPSLDVLEIKNFYVPNRRSKLCRCFIKIQKRTLLTVKLSTSYSGVQFYVKIYSSPKSGFSESESLISPVVVATAQSTNGSVLIPSVVLDHAEPLWEELNSEEESTVYILEAFIIKNTWPLTKQEWGIVEPLRVNGESWKDSSMNLTLKKSSLEGRKKITRMSKRSLNEQKVVGNPFWCLQVLSDSTESADPGDHVVVEEDKSYAEAVKAMKMSWEERNPGRRKKGRELRYNFLYECYLEEIRNRCKEEGGGEGEERGEEESDRGAQSNEENFKLSLERLSNFSYLTNDKSHVRCWKSPRVLPKVPMFELLRRHILCPPVEETEYFKAKVNPFKFKSLEVELPEQEILPLKNVSIKMFVSEMNYYRNLVTDYLGEEQKLTAQLMGEAYERRLKAIERFAR